MSKSTEKYRKKLLKAVKEALIEPDISYSLKNYVDSVIAYYLRTDDFVKEIENQISVFTGLKGRLNPDQLIPMQILDEDQDDSLSVKQRWENASNVLKIKPSLIRGDSPESLLNDILLVNDLVSALQNALEETFLDTHSEDDLWQYALVMISNIIVKTNDATDVSAREFILGKIRYLNAVENRFSTWPPAYKGDTNNMLSIDQFETKPPVSTSSDEAAS